MKKSRLIFQTWKSKTQFPPNFEQWMATWKKYNPEFQYILFDDKDNLNFVKENAKWFVPIFRKFPAEIMRADAVRYFFLFFEGGIYADMDFECLKSFKPFFKSDKVILGQMGSDELFPNSLPNAIMVAPRRFHVFWLFVLVELLKVDHYFEADGVEAATGPMMLQRAFIRYSFHSEKSVAEILKLPTIDFVFSKLKLPKKDIKEIHNSGVQILPEDKFYPINWNEPEHENLLKKGRALDLGLSANKKKLFPTSFAVTYWTGSWMSEKKK